MNTQYIRNLFFAALLVGVGGCTGIVETAVDSTANRAAQRTGEVVGERLGEAAGAMVVARFPDTWTVEWRQVYTGYLFNMAFHANGYAVTEQEAYEPGEWTRWQTIEDGEPTEAFFKRAFLARTEAGNEWWHVTYENAETEEAIVLEGLFAPGREEMLRLRGRFPGEEAKGMPVEDGTYGYSEPRQFTEESIEGATEGLEPVTVAGAPSKRGTCATGLRAPRSSGGWRTACRAGWSDICARPRMVLRTRTPRRPGSSS